MRFSGLDQSGHAMLWSMFSARSRSFLAGVLAGNSLPHLASAITARRHLTPIGGRDSGSAINRVWAGLNLAGACLLLRSTSAGGEQRSTGNASRSC